MIFNQFAFLLVFLPLVALVFFSELGRPYRIAWLVLASMVFYGISGLEHLLVLVCGILWVYAIARSDHFPHNPWLLILAIIVPAGALIYYKYATFLLTDVMRLEQRENPEVFSLFQQVLLPAGISFFTFQMISFAVDRYRGKIAIVPPMSHFALYISFFPQLVAGPILRLADVRERIESLVAYNPQRKNVEDFFVYVFFGLAAKVLVADRLGVYTGIAVSDPGGLKLIDAIYVVPAYSFQIYFDFYGYSLVAIGLGRLFGFSFPDNFRRPYETLNPRDFWRRWHITLSFWIRDYLYVPLGGNRHYVRNIVIVFAICGLWHGAGLTFVIWGLYHAGLVLGYHLLRGSWDAAPRSLQWSANFVLVTLGWLLFLFDFAGLQAFLESLSGVNGLAPEFARLKAWSILAVAAVCCFGIRLEDWVDGQGEIAAFSNIRSARISGTIVGVLILSTLMFIGDSQTFIYFRF